MQHFGFWASNSTLPTQITRVRIHFIRRIEPSSWYKFMPFTTFHVFELTLAFVLAVVAFIKPTCITVQGRQLGCCHQMTLTDIAHELTGGIRQFSHQHQRMSFLVCGLIHLSVLLLLMRTSITKIILTLLTLQYFPLFGDLALPPAQITNKFVLRFLAFSTLLQHMPFQTFKLSHTFLTFFLRNCRVGGFL